jgi:hypothetical protein
VLLPQSGLRQWVLTFPFPWRRRLAQDGALLGNLTLRTSEVGAVLESTVRRIERHLRRRGLLGIDEDGADPDVPGDPESNLRAEPSARPDEERAAAPQATAARSTSPPPPSRARRHPPGRSG